MSVHTYITRRGVEVRSGRPGLTVVDGSFNDATTAEAALAQDWYIDPVNGNDVNDGSATRALQTHEEMRRRIGDSVINQATNVHLLNDFNDTNPVIVDFRLGESGTLAYIGEKPLTTLATGTITAITGTNPLLNLQLEISDTSLEADWGAAGLLNTVSLFRQIRITSGSSETTGSVAYPTRDGTAGTRTTRCSDFKRRYTALPNSGLVPQTPVVGSTYVVETGLTRISTLAVDIACPAETSAAPGNQRLLFSNLELSNNDNRKHPINATGPVRFGGQPPSAPVVFSGCNTGGAGPTNGTYVLFDACKMGETESGFGSLTMLGGPVNLLTSLVVRQLQLQGEGRSNIGGLTLFDLGATLSVTGPAYCVLNQVGIFNGNTALLIAQGGVVRCTPDDDPAKHLYGSGSSFAVIIQAGSQLQYSSPKPTITGSVDIRLGGSTSVMTWSTFGDDVINTSNQAAIIRIQ